MEISLIDFFVSFFFFRYFFIQENSKLKSQKIRFNLFVYTLNNNQFEKNVRQWLLVHFEKVDLLLL